MFQSQIWFWGLLMYKISFNKQTKLKLTISMTITSSLRFLYILGNKLVMNSFLQCYIFCFQKHPFGNYVFFNRRIFDFFFLFSLQIRGRNYERVEKLFQRCLMKVLNIDLWKTYLNYVKDTKASLPTYKYVSRLF